MTQQTAVEWLEDNLIGNPFSEKDFIHNVNVFKQAKAMEKEQMIGFAEYVAGHSDKNRNYLDQMLHARSKYDEANRTVDLLEQYYNETYGE